MAPTFKHGKNAYFAITSTTGGTINLSSGLAETSLSRSLDTAEVTTFGDGDKNYIPGLRDATFSVSGHYSSTHADKLDPLIGWSTLPTFTFGPEGNTVTNIKYTGKTILTSLEYGASVGDKINLSLSFQCSGAITSTNF